MDPSTLDSSERSVVKLIMVTENNNNKFYIMTKINTSEWEAQWGRVQGDLSDINQTSFQRKIYPTSTWDKTYKSKTKKGYTDVTHLYEVIDASVGDDEDGKPKDPTGAIKDAKVKQLMIDLQKFASISVKANYTISSDNVTQTMIDEAQTKLDIVKAMAKIKGNYKNLNTELLEFYKIIPRKMDHVRNYLLDSLLDKESVKKAQKMILNEQDTLDVMAGQVKLKQQQKEEDEKTKVKEDKDKKEVKEKKPISLLDQMGMTVELASTEEFKKVRDLAGPEANKIKKVYTVVNKTTQKKYDNHTKVKKVSEEPLLWHGSRNQNWFNILQTGLLIRPSGAIHTGSMFGDGIYFANKARKSIGYSSLRGSYWTSGGDNKGYLALFKTNVGNQKHIRRHSYDCYKLNQKVLDKEGFDSVFAHGGIDLRNDEFIVYASEKCTIAYIIEIG